MWGWVHHIRVYQYFTAMSRALCDLWTGLWNGFVWVWGRKAEEQGNRFIYREDGIRMRSLRNYSNCEWASRIKTLPEDQLKGIIYPFVECCFCAPSLLYPSSGRGGPLFLCVEGTVLGRCCLPWLVDGWLWVQNSGTGKSSTYTPTHTR